MQITLTLQLKVEKFDILTILSFPNHEQKASLHLFRSYLISFLSIFWFFINRFCTYFVRFIPKYYIFVWCNWKWYFFFFLLYWVLVVASRIFNPCCSMQTLSCGMWDLVPQPGINPRPPALGVRSLSHWTTKDVSGNGNFFFIKNSNCSFLVCKPIIDFCIFKMYPASFLFLLISSTFGGQFDYCFITLL